MMKRSLLLLVFTLALVGCAQIPTQQSVTWKSHQQQLANLNDWAFSGKLAFITPEEKRSLNIHWSQSGDDFHIRLLVPILGSTVLDVQKTQDGTQIIDNNGEHYFGKDTELLIAQLSGLVIPIDLLLQWIKGNPINASYQLNENNQVVSLFGLDSKNANWSIDYSDYKNTQGINLPYKLQLKRPDLRLKFAISKWEINTAY